MNYEFIALDARQKELLGQALEWRLIALLLACPSEPWREKVRLALAEVRDPSLREAAGNALAAASEGGYHSIFGPGGLVSPREVSHHRRLEFGGLLSELAGFYSAFAYRPSAEEPADHVSVETDFVAYLRLKEAFALACGEPVHAEITAEACRLFLEEHLSVLAVPLRDALSHSGVRYLEIAAEALLARSGRPKTAQFPIMILDPRLDDPAPGCGANASEP